MQLCTWVENTSSIGITYIEYVSCYIDIRMIKEGASAGACLNSKFV